MNPAILDAFIPADSELGMPSAADLDFAGYAARHGIGALTVALENLVEDLARSQHGEPFEALDEGCRLQVLQAARSRDFRGFSDFVTHLFRAYYSDRKVLSRLGAGAVPPFHEGNALEADDWSLLEPVYDRGPIYRTWEERP